KGLKDQEMRIGDLDAQAAKLTELRQQTAQLRDQVSSQESVFASLEQQTESVTNQIEAYNDLVEARKNAQMSPQFSTSVRTVYPEWGFVVLGAGNNQGVMEGATLVVRRGGSEVTRLKVTELYQNTSVADILPGGTPPQPGDSVYS